MDKILTKVVEYGTEYGLNVLGAILIFVVGRIVAGWLKKVIRTVLLKKDVDETLVYFSTSLGYVAMMTFVIIAALGTLGIPTASFVAVIGAASLAIGLALQGSLSNFAAGALMIIFKPFKISDFIEGGGVSGVVEEIGIFTTNLKSADNKKLIVPNSKMMGDTIVNFSAKDQRRVDLVVGVSYGDDLDLVKKVLMNILSSDDRILKDPAPTIAVLELADSSVNLVVRPWVKTANYWDVYFATQENVKKRFDAEGITIPFPQQDVHMHTCE